MVIEGSVIVDQRPPSEQVDEQAVEVMVGVATPEVSVTEGQVDILVRQAAPMINFDMRQPTITIVQPAPEIIITMPDPSVDVANTRPRVEVRQAHPRVSISMPDPTVELELYHAEDAANSPGIVVNRREATGADATARDPVVTFARADAQGVTRKTARRASADERNAQYVIVDVGGFLGMGEHQVRVPLTDLSILQRQTSSEVRVYVNASEERLMAYSEVN